MQIIYCIMQFICYNICEVNKMQKNSKLKIARMKLDLTQQDLADRVGVTRQTIGLIEAGKYNPTINLCILICQTLHTTLNDLFWEEEQ